MKLNFDITEMLNNGLSVDDILGTVKKTVETEMAKNADAGKKDKARTTLITAIRDYAKTNLAIDDEIINFMLSDEILIRTLKGFENDEDVKKEISRLKRFTPKNFSKSNDAINQLLKDLNR